MIIPETFNPYLDVFEAVGGDGRRADRLLRDAYAKIPDGGTVTGLGPVDLTEYDEAMRGTWRRYDWTVLFSWAIPNDEAIRTIAAHAPILEVGAGTGYWAWLLRKLDVDVVATDRHEPDQHWNGTTWTDVEPLGAVEAVEKHGTGRALLIVWPPMTTMASDALDAYTGDTLIYVGEPDGGCNADADFHFRIRMEWTEATTVRIPQWWGLHDYLSVYRRIRTGKPQGLDPKRLEGT